MVRSLSMLLSEPVILKPRILLTLVQPLLEEYLSFFLLFILYLSGKFAVFVHSKNK